MLSLGCVLHEDFGTHRNSVTDTCLETQLHEPHQFLKHLFLCEGDVFIEALYDMELNDLMNGWTRGCWTEMVGSQVANDTLVGGTASGDLCVSNTGVLQQVADGKSEVSQLMELRSMVRRPRELGPRQPMTTTRLIDVVKRSQMVFRCWRMRCALVRCTHELKTDKQTSASR